MAVFVLLLGACGGSNQPTPPGPSETSASPPSAPPTTQPPAQTAGTIVDVSFPLALLDGRQVFAGDAIAPRQTVSTDGQGSVDFNLKKKIKDCRLFPQSAVQVQPTSSVLVKYAQGSTLCLTTTGPTTGVMIDSSGVQIAVQDPVYLVSVDEGQTQVAVAEGFVKLGSLQTGTGTTVLVGPDQLSVVPAGEDPQPPGSFDFHDLPPAEADAWEQFKDATPPPDYSAPDADGSSTLRRIFDRGAILVGFDEGESEDQESQAFSEGFFSFLADSWGLKFGPSLISREVASEALQSGRIDIFVSTQPLAKGGVLQFFTDATGRIWTITTPSNDDRFLNVIRGFLIKTLVEGDYADRYRRAFDGAEPPYDALASLIGP